MTTTDVTRLIAELRGLPLAEIQARLDAIDAERQALMTLRRIAVRAQRGKSAVNRVVQEAATR